MEIPPMNPSKANIDKLIGELEYQLAEEDCKEQNAELALIQEIQHLYCSCSFCRGLDSRHFV